MEHSCKLCACSHLGQGKPKQTRPRKIGRCQETQGRNSRGRTQVRKRRNLFSATLAYLCAATSLGCHVQYQSLGVKVLYSIYSTPISVLCGRQIILINDIFVWPSALHLLYGVQYQHLEVGGVQITSLSSAIYFQV